MADRDPGPDPIRHDLERAASLYAQLAARVHPGSNRVSRRVAPGSRPPVNLQMVSAMAELADYLAWWTGNARWLLDPVGKVDLTTRTGARCPYDNGDLVAWIRAADPDAAEIVCTNLDHDDQAGPRRWRKDQWPRLGVLTGVHVDARFGARLRTVGD